MPKRTLTDAERLERKQQSWSPNQFKTHDTKADGFGSPSQWKAIFGTVMGIEEAQEEQRKWKPGTTARTLFGIEIDMSLPRDEQWALISARRGVLIREYFPEMRRNAETGEMYMHGDMAKWKQVMAAFAILKREYGK